MKQKLSFDDRIWMWGNRKPPTVWGSYFWDKFIWVAYGLWLSAGAIAIDSGKWQTVILGVLLLVFLVWFAALVAKQDKERGYADAIHKNQLDRWEKRMAKINSILAENKKE